MFESINSSVSSGGSMADIINSSQPDLRKEWNESIAVDAWSGKSVKANEQNRMLNAHRGSTVEAQDGSLVRTDGDCDLPSTISREVSHQHAKFIGRFYVPYKTTETIHDPNPAWQALKPANVVALSGSKVFAEDATVEAHSGSYVQAIRGSEVTALAGSSVLAQNDSKITGYPGARIVADAGHRVTVSGGTVTAMPYSSLNVSGNAEVVAKPYSRVTSSDSNVKAEKDSFIDAKGRGQIDALSGSEILASDDVEKIIAREGSLVRLYFDNMRRDNNSANTVIEAEGGANLIIGRPDVIVKPNGKVDLGSGDIDVTFNGSFDDLNEFRSKNADLKFSHIYALEKVEPDSPGDGLLSEQVLDVLQLPSSNARVKN